MGLGRLVCKRIIHLSRHAAMTTPSSIARRIAAAQMAAAALARTSQDTLYHHWPVRSAQDSVRFAIQRPRRELHMKHDIKTNAA